MPSAADIRVLAQQMEALASRVGDLIETLENPNSNSNVQRVIVQQAGIGSWQVAGVCACFFTMFALIIALIFIVPQLHDLQAWEGVVNRDVAVIKATLPKEIKP